MADFEKTFWDKIQYMFTSPQKLFDLVKEETKIYNALIMIGIALAFNTIASLGFSFTRGASWGFGEPVVSGLGSILLYLIGAFAYSGLIVLFILIFRKGARYSDAFNIYAHSMVPYFVLSVIPFIGWLSIIYAVYLMIIGASQIFGISKGNAAIACIVPGLIIFLILLGLVMLFVAFAFRSGGGLF